MKIPAVLLGALYCLFAMTVSAEESVRLSTRTFAIDLDSAGRVVHMTDTAADTDYTPTGEHVPLLSLRINGKFIKPNALKRQKSDELTLTFPSGRSAMVKATEHPSHIAFELVSLDPANDVELVLWGPYPTTIAETVGETVGVVRNGSFAIGIQTLNPKTIGGYPNEESDVMPSYDIFEGDDYSDIGDEHRDRELYRGDTAKHIDSGSVLQAYCRNRSRERIIANWKHERYVAPAFDDGGVIGTKIALFGCPTDKALETIGEIEIAEGLPHPSIDGEWLKSSPGAAAAYMILPFGVDTIDKAVMYTKKAGLHYLYHPDPFETWGHFPLKKQYFPDGIASLKHCVDYADRQEVLLGVHTLSNFITTTDAYVTPVPDKRLAKVGTSRLTEDITTSQTDIPIADPGFFNQMGNNNLKTVMIDDELIRYGTVTASQPYLLTGCERGAFGTTTAPHSAGREVGKLMDHGYKVFLTDTDLMFEVAGRLADLFNKTGLRQISFDGLEGNWSTGMGQYARTLFTKAWYDNLSDDLRGTVITDASNPGHYFWHMYTRMNWGEPWYAGFRESQTQYRLKNQLYFARNLMPRMLGWFRLSTETSREDIEWLLARSTGFDAGYSLFTGFDALEGHGMIDEILAMIGTWEEARLTGAFCPEQKSRLQDIGMEFHLEPNGNGRWMLYPLHVERFRHEKKTLQPGQPVFTKHSFENPYREQSLCFIITAKDGGVRDISIEIDSHRTVSLPVTLEKGDILVYEDGLSARVYDSGWHEKVSVSVEANALIMAGGTHRMTFDCNFEGGDKPSAAIELRLTGEPEPVGNRR